MWFYLHIRINQIGSVDVEIIVFGLDFIVEKSAGFCPDLGSVDHDI